MEKIHIVILPLRVSNIWDLTKYFFYSTMHIIFLKKENIYLYQFHFQVPFIMIAAKVLQSITQLITKTHGSVELFYNLSLPTRILKVYTDPLNHTVGY